MVHIPIIAPTNRSKNILLLQFFYSTLIQGVIDARCDYEVMSMVRK
jgi:hypothetical protein